MKQAMDFLDETQDLFHLLDEMNTSELTAITQFNGWTFEDVIGHLHMFDHAAALTIRDKTAFQSFFAPISKALNNGTPLLQLQNDWLGDLRGEALMNAWHDGFSSLAHIYSEIDPKTRIQWAGPDMSARSAITARQMETWAHGQAIYDTLGIERQDSQRIKNIAHMGVATCGWTFVNRGWAVPDPLPQIVLTSPDGEVWQWNTPQDDNTIKASATEFCQIVTQTRNVADTALVAVGKGAIQWMGSAQCFAGPPHNPPKPGSRFRITR